MENKEINKYIDQLFENFSKLQVGDHLTVDPEKIGILNNTERALPEYFYEKFALANLEFEVLNQDPDTREAKIVCYITKKTPYHGITVSWKPF